VVVPNAVPGVVKLPGFALVAVLSLNCVC
jgi:hypothetical protein